MSIFKPVSENKAKGKVKKVFDDIKKTRNIKKIPCLLYTSPSPRDED